MASFVPHIVLTRLGLGICRPEFFDAHVEYMRRSAGLSLSSQTDDGLIWVVATDILAPKDIEDRILDIGVPRTHVWRIDPVSSGMDPLCLRRLPEIVPSGEVILTRLDDDDLLHPDFAKLTRQIFLSEGEIAANTFPHGLNLFANGSVQRQSYPWIGLGLSIKSNVDRVISPYRIKHTLISKVIDSAGGKSIVTNTEEPFWIRSIHADSDSDFRWRGRRKKAHLEVMDLSIFGLYGQALSDLCRALGMPSANTPVAVPDQPVVYSRLELKARILAELRKAIRDTPGDHRIFALKQAFYSL